MCQYWHNAHITISAALLEVNSSIVACEVASDCVVNGFGAVHKKHCGVLPRPVHYQSWPGVSSLRIQLKYVYTYIYIYIYKLAIPLCFQEALRANAESHTSGFSVSLSSSTCIPLQSLHSLPSHCFRELCLCCVNSCSSCPYGLLLPKLHFLNSSRYHHGLHNQLLPTANIYGYHFCRDYNDDCRNRKYRDSDIHRIL